MRICRLCRAFSDEKHTTCIVLLLHHMKHAFVKTPGKIFILLNRGFLFYIDVLSHFVFVIFSLYIFIRIMGADDWLLLLSAGRTLQIFNLDLKAKMKSHNMTEGI